MKPEAVLAHPPVVLTAEQRRFFFDHGFLALPGHVPAAWVRRLRGAMNELLDRSRGYTQSDDTFVLEEGHSADNPRLHRISSPQDHHPAFWEFMRDPVMTDVAADVMGPDVKFHHAKLNVKAGDGTRGFKWHQDIQAWPHTDFSPVSIGVYIEGCAPDQGPLAFVRDSHKGRLFSMYDDAGNFVVRIRDEEAGWIKDNMIEAPTGPAGTVVLVNCRIVHGSVINTSKRNRPLLLAVYSSADSFAFTPSPIRSVHQGEIVRGGWPREASFAPYDFELPPDWSGGYRTAWTYQKEEEQRKAAGGSY
jgi:ectoine hydroxylase